ncbi:MAG: sensor domain-containing diguanylate cyclase [Pseudomonadota bacterium]
MLSLGIVVFLAAYVAISNVVAEQSRVQQQAITPVYQLVRDELLKPLYIAETFASSVDFTALMDSPDFDEDKLLTRLRDMERDLGLVFFVASELKRKQYMSTGQTLNLVAGEVSWYFEAKARDNDFMADLGQVGDVHLFFDVKVYGNNEEFLGYVGVGKRIQQFLDTFNQYKSRYGYDFLFVNEKNQIILSSLPDLVVTDAYVPTLESLNWFDEETTSQRRYDSEILELEDGEYLISEIGIEELDWRLLLLAPLEARQAQVTRSFLANAFAAALFVLLAAAIGVFMVLYKRSIDRKAEEDVLTGLPNRAGLERRFGQLQKAGVELCAIIIDLDHFKMVNDVHGHDAGDRVLKAAATIFKRGLREADIVGRWGGEEFVMLIPARSIELGRTIAERARHSLECLSIETQRDSVSVTASFGIAFGSSSSEALAEIVGRADRALYQAKGEGRNLVRLTQAA